jgi:uncharacterized protein (UPF0335 family)
MFNRPEDDAPVTGSEEVNSDQLKAIVERIERVEVELQDRKDDIKDIYSEAKGNGFDVKIIRKIVKLRKQDRQQRQEEQEILDLYCAALGIEQ